MPRLLSKSATDRWLSKPFDRSGPQLLTIRRVSSVVEHSSANPKVPGSIPGPVSYRGHGL